MRTMYQLKTEHPTTVVHPSLLTGTSTGIIKPILQMSHVKAITHTTPPVSGETDLSADLSESKCHVLTTIISLIQGWRR